MSNIRFTSGLQIILSTLSALIYIMHQRLYIRATYNMIRFNQKPLFSFVKQKQLDLITNNYGSTKWQKIKMYGAMFGHIGVEGFKGFKSDFRRYFFQLKKKQQLTDEETHEMMRIRDDIYKIGPLIIIQILPFSGPLFMLYMYTYPGSIPSWFLIDYHHDKHQQLKLTNQKRAMKFFNDAKISHQNFSLDSLSLRQLRKLSLLLFGYYRDGTIGYRKLFNKKIQYFITQSFSKYLIKQQLKKRFDRDLFCSAFTNNMITLQEKVKWKFEKIMNGEYHIQYNPLYQQSQTKMEQDGMSLQAKIFQNINSEQQNSLKIQKESKINQQRLKEKRKGK